jgi:hypothetical protein
VLRLKIGAGGLNAQIAQEMVNARATELTKLKPPLKEEVLGGQQKNIPELNKPLLDPHKAAELYTYLKSKETEDEAKKRKRKSEKDEEDNKEELPKTCYKPKYNVGVKGYILDEYK